MQRKISFIVFNITGLSTLILVAYSGLLTVPIQQDPTYLIVTILALHVCGVFATAYCLFFDKGVRWLRTQEEILVTLGLIGTVLGFSTALGVIDPNTATVAEQAANMASALLYGVSIALNTTLAGAIGFAWTTINRRLVS